MFEENTLSDIFNFFLITCFLCLIFFDNIDQAVKMFLLTFVNTDYRILIIWKYLVQSHHPTIVGWFSKNATLLKLQDNALDQCFFNIHCVHVLKWLMVYFVKASVKKQFCSEKMCLHLRSSQLNPIYLITSWRFNNPSQFFSW